MTDTAFVHIDLGAAAEVAVVDLIDVYSAGAYVADAWRVEYSTDDAAWTTFGDTFDMQGSETFTRRAALAPGVSVMARYWRLVATAALSGRTISVENVRMWAESASLSAVKVFGFTYSSDATYAVVLTDRALEVYDDGVHIGSVYCPHTHDQIPRVNRAQSLDTLILFHQDVAPWRVFRQGDGSEWDSRAQDLENIPLIKFAGSTYVNGTNEEQEVLTLGMTSGTDRFSLSYAGKVSPAITYAGDNSTTAENIEAALEATEDVGAGNVSVTKTATNTFTVEFIGDLAQMEHPILGYTFLGPGTGDEVLQVSRVVQGKAGGEAIISATRGWPGCGTFHQARLLMSGLKSRPETALFSVLGDRFNFDVELAVDGAVSVDIGGDEIKLVNQVYSGTSLGFFTDEQEIWVTDRVIAKGSPISFATGTKRGVKYGLDILDADDQTLFVRADGSAVHAFVYTDAQQRYVAPNLSRLAPHLVDDPLDWAQRRGGENNGAELVLLANQNGGAGVAALMSEEQFLAWHNWDTDGDFIAFGTEGRETVYAVIERTVDGTTTRRLEIYDEALLYDAGLSATHDPAVTSQDGLDHLEGKTVELWLDGRPWGAAVVSGGAVDFPADAGAITTVQVGLPFTVEAETLPVRDAQYGSAIGRMARIFSVTLSLLNTGAVSVSANGRPARTLSLRTQMVDAFASVDAALFTGDAELAGIAAYKRGTTATISQPFRAPLHVRSILAEVRLP